MRMLCSSMVWLVFVAHNALSSIQACESDEIRAGSHGVSSHSRSIHAISTVESMGIGISPLHIFSQVPSMAWDAYMAKLFRVSLFCLTDSQNKSSYFFNILFV